MIVNIVGPYSPVPSAPRHGDVSFYAPGHANFLFTKTDPVIVCLPIKRSLELKWTLSPNWVKTPLTSGVVEPGFDNSFHIAIPKSGLVPGFYDLRVEVKLSGTETVSGQTTFGWQADEMKVHTELPPDFAQFWQKAMGELDQTAPLPTCSREKTFTRPQIDQYNVKEASLPEDHDSQGVVADTVEVYRVHFSSYGGKIIEGWFAKPAGKGPFPALLVLPGAGNTPRPIPLEHARHGYASLTFQVYGNPVDASHYDAPPSDREAATPRDFQHFGIYLNALQAARVLKDLPGVDVDRLAVLGGSQGGRLTVVVAALDTSFKAAIPAITHFAYQPWQWWTERMNKAKSDGGKEGYTGADRPPDETGRPENYLDPLNFASRIRCPVLMNVGMTDTTSPSTSIFALYDQIKSPKEIIPLPNTGHDWAPAFDRYAWKWLAKTLADGSVKNDRLAGRGVSSEPRPV